MTNKFLLSDEGRAYLSIYMKPFTDKTLLPVQFKVDSGADLSTISKKELVLLGYSYEWIERNIVKDIRHTLSRAGGKSHLAYFVQINLSNLLGRDLLNWPFYIRAEHHLDFSNLIGINILQHFNFQFNYDDWTFHIEANKNPKRVSPMLPNQNICEILIQNIPRNTIINKGGRSCQT